MRTRNLCIASVCFTSFVLSHNASANYSNQGGQSCVPTTTDIDVGYNNFGVSNGNTSSASAVYCPVAWVEDSTIGLNASAMYVFYYDGNSSYAIDCFSEFQDQEENEYFGAADYSCGTGGNGHGGCTSNSNPAYTTGSAPDLNYLTLTPPSEEYLANSTIYCSLPAWSSPSAPSSIIGYVTVYDPTY